jgi:hypothetical protein
MESGFDFRQVKIFFFLLRSVQTVTGAHPASYTMATGGCFTRKKQQGREADYLPPYSAKVKNMELYPHSPIHLHGMMLN